ncbi:MAG: hypothetical protein F6K17_27055 [Okeania sp. SIO3C4]|nr:hypothetical protein [Okeania sp. SIO3C4]
MISVLSPQSPGGERITKMTVVMTIEDFFYIHRTYAEQPYIVGANGR